PPRVLDLGDTFSPHVSLIEPAHREVGSRQYMTLSHLSSLEPLKKWELTTKNIALLQAGIPVTSLPPLYQDAVAVCHYLGIQNLWIFAACVAQDDPVDVFETRGQMGEIVRHAHCNIEAANA
ncbi:hypothetical protein P152DRAFT_380442, partial [Eremomyces bilateralis CBS 781.70]